MKEDCETAKSLQVGNPLIKLLSCKHVLPFKIREAPSWEQTCKYRGRGPSVGTEEEMQATGTEAEAQSIVQERRATGPKGGALRERITARSWNIRREICLARFWKWLGQETPFHFPFSPFWNRNVCNRYPIACSHHCNLKAGNFSVSLVLRGRGILPQERPYQSFTHTWFRWSKW